MTSPKPFIRKAFVAVLGVALSTLALASVVSTAATSASADTVPAPVRELGIYPGYANVGGVVSTEAWLGRQFKYVTQFGDTNAASFTSSVWGEVAKAGAMQLLQDRVTLVEAVPLAFGGIIDANTAQGQALARGYLTSTVNGANDALFRQAAVMIRDGGFPDAILRLGWEFDGGWYPWSAQGNCGLYQDAFRRVHDIFASVSPSFRFDWNATSWFLSDDAGCAWPGDGYVTTVGLNFYDAGLGVPWNSATGTWVNPTTAFNARVLPYLKIQRDFAMAHGKQVSYPEWAMASSIGQYPGGGDNPTYIQGMYDWMSGLPSAGPGSLLYQSYFNQDLPDGGRYALYHFPQGQARYYQLFGPAAGSVTAPPPDTPDTTPPSGGVPDQTLPAETASTNLPSETVWPGYHGTGALCCWGSQGQFVTFTFTVPGGSTNLGIRYSSGNSNSTRKIELDGVVINPNQVFPKTAWWNTWSVLTLNANLSAGQHQLKIWFDATSGSSAYLNIDELTVDAG